MKRKMAKRSPGVDEDHKDQMDLLRTLINNKPTTNMDIVNVSTSSLVVFRLA
jgi:hypothetical protein